MAASPCHRHDFVGASSRIILSLSGERECNGVKTAALHIARPDVRAHQCPARQPLMAGAASGDRSKQCNRRRKWARLLVGNTSGSARLRPHTSHVLGVTTLQIHAGTFLPGAEHLASPRAPFAAPTCGLNPGNPPSPTFLLSRPAQPNHLATAHAPKCAKSAGICPKVW